MKSDKQRQHLQRLAELKRGTHHSEETKKKISISRHGYNGSNHPSWKGGRIIVGGYVYIHTSDHPNKTQDNYVCEHRLVMEEYLGRYLTHQEVVHHINGNRLDNRIQNLVVCQSTGKHVAANHAKRNRLGQFV